MVYKPHSIMYLILNDADQSAENKFKVKCM